MGKNSLGECLRKCRQLCLQWLVDCGPKGRRLGGPGRPVELLWCSNYKTPDPDFLTVCLVEVTGGEDAVQDVIFVVESCPGANLEAVTALVLKYVDDGSTIFTDVLCKLGFHKGRLRFRVDRESRTLVPTADPEPVLRLPILGLVQRHLPAQPYHRLLLAYLGEFLYHWEVTRTKADRFWHFVGVVKRYYPGQM